MKRHRWWALLFAVPIAFIVIRLFDSRPRDVTLIYDVSALGVKDASLDVKFFKDGDEVRRTRFERVERSVRHPTRLPTGDFTVRFVVTTTAGERIAIDRTVKIEKEGEITLYLAR